jgi:putative addiction module antidote
MFNLIKLRKAGGSISATLPKAMMERLRLKAGDPMFAVETEQGILLTPFDPEFERALAVYERGSRKYRQALRELA